MQLDVGTVTIVLALANRIFKPRRKCIARRNLSKRFCYFFFHGESKFQIVHPKSKKAVIPKLCSYTLESGLQIIQVSI